MDPRAPVDPRKLLTWLGLAVGIVALVLQFVLSMQAYAAIGKDIPGGLGTFLAFYTILTNIVLVLAYLSAVTAWPWLDLFRHPVTRAMMAANIALVMLYVYFVLRFLVTLTGLDQLADTLLHYLGPVLYILWWLVTQKHGSLKWSNLPLMLAPTLVYFLYILARGAWVNEYPYPILAVNKIGYGAVFLNALAMLVAFAILTAIVIALDHLLARLSRTNPV
ncbi:Pr6Pr family membrane protein [uncultured Devosia sp.]|uniref:Pr6Pr family membrane protein n=1 Tax=uncultured Devosia sp. TaxID=211434 RepID=UPI0035C9ADA2